MKIYDYKGRKNISGNRIREARLKKRLSQADFAAKLQIAGITMERDSVSRIEIGTRFVADYELMIRAEILDVTGAVDKVASENQQWEFEQKKRRSLASFHGPYHPLQVQSGR